MPFRSTEAYRKFRQDQRDALQRAKSKPCTDCKVAYPYYVMDFDHREGAEKAYTVNKMVGRCGLDVILAEVSKCDVVCANCHRKRTFQRNKPNPSSSTM